MLMVFSTSMLRTSLLERLKLLLSVQVEVSLIQTSRRWSTTLKLPRKLMVNVESRLTLRMRLTRPSTTPRTSWRSTPTRSPKTSKIRSTETSLLSTKPLLPRTLTKSEKLLSDWRPPLWKSENLSTPILIAVRLEMKTPKPRPRPKKSRKRKSQRRKRRRNE